VRAADHPRLKRFYEQLGFKCADRSTTDAHGHEYFDYFWYPGKFEVFIHENGKPSIKIA